MPGHDINDLLGKFLQSMLEGQTPSSGQGQSRGTRRPAPERNRPVPPPRPPQRTPLEAEVVEAEPVTGDDVAEYVERHLDSRRVTEHASHLGQEVAQAQDALAAHQRQLFGSGPKGNLAKTGPDTSTTGTAPSVKVDQSPSAAREIADLFRSPQDLRTAFILSEILRRPEW